MSEDWYLTCEKCKQVAFIDDDLHMPEDCRSPYLLEFIGAHVNIKDANIKVWRGGHQVKQYSLWAHGTRECELQEIRDEDWY